MTLIYCCFSCTGEKTPKSRYIEANKIYINAKNPTDNDFPGGRGPDELIIYTRVHGRTTGTNPYGLEAVVKEGRVVRVEGNSSAIPENGFVVSGHGKALRWITGNLYPGVAVRVKGDSLYIKSDAEARLIYAQYLMNEVRHSNLPDSLKTLYEAAVKEARSERNNPDKSVFMEKAKEALQTAKDCFYSSFESPEQEIRATWFRITAASAAELEVEIRKIADIGFNMICPETIFGGYAIYPDAHPDLPQHPQFDNWDPLAELVRLSKKYELKLVPWVWVYHVGQKDSYLANHKREWLAVSRQLEYPSQIEKGYHFFCPARKEVRQFWVEVYTKMIENYDLDGLQLDYIRYPVSLPYEKGYCYCDNCRRKFQNLGHPDPLEIDPHNNPEEWAAWKAFRIEQVSVFVAEVDQLLKNMGSEVKLSADVFPVPEESIASKMQDWQGWLEKGYLDEIFTMSYTPDAETVRKEAKLLAGIVPGGIKAYVGLGPYQKFRPEILLNEIRYTRQAGVDGVCLFAFQALTPEQIEALKKGPFRNKAKAD